MYWASSAINRGQICRSFQLRNLKRVFAKLSDCRRKSVRMNFLLALQSTVDVPAPAHVDFCRRPPDINLSGGHVHHFVDAAQKSRGRAFSYPKGYLRRHSVFQAPTYGLIVEPSRSYGICKAVVLDAADRDRHAAAEAPSLRNDVVLAKHARSKRSFAGGGSGGRGMAIACGSCSPFGHFEHRELRSRV